VLLLLMQLNLIGEASTAARQDDIGIAMNRLPGFKIPVLHGHGHGQGRLRRQLRAV